MGIRTELALRLPNSPGAAAAVCHLLAGERVNILAMMLASTGHLHLIVDNPSRAVGVLTGQHHKVVERSVVVVPAPHAPGGLAPILALVRDAGVNIDYAYSGIAEAKAAAAVVLGVDDAPRAAAAAGV